MTTRLIVAFLLIAAPTPTQPPEFEVASVKENTLDDRIVTVNVGPGGRFAVRGYTLVLLIQRAYGVMDWNVTGGPDWIRTARFDIAATANIEGNLAEAQLQPMLGALLAKRFQLALHRSTREMSGYALEIAKKGLKLTPAAAPTKGQEGFRYNATGLAFQAITLHDFARYVGGKLGIVAQDETGLKGLYDFNVTWRVLPDLSAEDPREAMRTAVMSAIQDQLGLKFIQKKVSVPILVIDHAQKASAAEN